MQYIKRKSRASAFEPNLFYSSSMYSFDYEHLNMGRFHKKQQPFEQKAEKNKCNLTKLNNISNSYKFYLKKKK